jgi:hypothetical protein
LSSGEELVEPDDGLVGLDDVSGAAVVGVAVGVLLLPQAVTSERRATGTM